MSLKDVDPDRVDLVLKLNNDLSILHTKCLNAIATGVCEAYPEQDPMKVAFIQLVTVIRFSTQLQVEMINALMYGLEGLGVMQEVPDKVIKDSPEYKAMKEHFERLKKEK